MPNLYYVEGDVTEPNLNRVMIAHVCNDIGKMGSGVAKAIYTKWPIVKKEYQEPFKYLPEPQLGQVIFVKVEDSIKENRYIIVANMIAQHKTIADGEAKPIRYKALDACLKNVYNYCYLNNLELHMPRIGSGLARGEWDDIEKIIYKNLKVDTYIYTLPQEKIKFKLTSQI